MQKIYHKMVFYVFFFKISMKRNRILHEIFACFLCLISLALMHQKFVKFFRVNRS